MDGKSFVLLSTFYLVLMLFSYIPSPIETTITYVNNSPHIQKDIVGKQSIIKMQLVLPAYLCMSVRVCCWHEQCSLPSIYIMFVIITYAFCKMARSFNLVMVIDS